MTKKIALTKIENDQNEVGIQLRDSAPVTQKEGRIYIDRNTGEMKGFINNKDVHLSFDLYESDPVLPADKQAWINRSSNQLKWFFNGVVKSISLDDGAKLADVKSSSHYLSTLNEEEIGNIADVSTAFPNYLLDAFNGKTTGSIKTNTELKQSGLSVVDGMTAGDYKLEKKGTSGYNYAEGSVVVKAKSFKPKLITDNADGTHEIKFDGDLTPYIMAGQKMLAMEIEGDKKLHLLNGDLNPSILIVDSVVYSIGETTIVIQDNNLDLSFGGIALENINFKPLNMKFLAGSKGLTGNLTELEIVEAEALDSLSSILGDEQLKHITTALKNEKIYAVRWNHSANKQNWIIQAMVTSTDIGRLSGTVYMWKSTDGLTTLEFVKDWFNYATFPADDQNIGLSNYYGHANKAEFHNDIISIADDGRYVFGCVAFTLANFYANFGFFGNLNSSDAPRKFTHQHVTAYPGQWGMDNGNNYYQVSVSMDWDENILIIGSVNQAHDPYYIIYKIDFINNQTPNHGYFFLGAEFQFTDYQSLVFMKEFEGEKQLFIISPHTNEYNQAFKFRYKRMFDDIASGLLTGFNAGSYADISAVVSAYDGDKYFMNAFSNSLEGGLRGETANYAHTQTTIMRRVIDHGWDVESDSLVCLIADDNDFGMQLSITNFGRTRYGKTNHTRLEFDVAPTAGNLTLSFFDENTGTTEITSPFAFSNTASQLKSIIEALSFVGVGNCTVTGDFVIGFDITFKVNTMRKQMNITVNSQSISNGGTPTVITVNEIEAGEKPIWLRHTSKTTNTVANSDANGWDFHLDDYLISNFNFAGGTAESHQTSRRLWKKQTLVVKNKTIMFVLDLAPTDGAHDSISPLFYKIPDYTEMVGYGDWALRNTDPTTGNGSRQYNTGTAVTTKLAHKSKHSLASQNGYRLAQRWNTGTDINGVYPDGKIPVRTMMIKLSKYYWTTDTKVSVYDKDDQFIRLRIMPVGIGGKPDWENPIALSKKKMLRNLPNASDWKWEQFIFDDVRLDQGTNYFFGIELVGVDLEREGEFNENHSAIEITGRTIADDQTCFSYRDNTAGDAKEWKSQGMHIHFRWLDFYEDKIYALHENGENKRIITYTPEWHDGRIVGEGTLVEKSNGDMLATYRTGYHAVNDYTNYSPFNGGSTPYIFSVKDINGKYKLPTFTAPKVMGGMEDWDENLVLAHATGHIDCIEYNKDGTPFKYSAEEDDYKYDRNTSYGGFYASSHIADGDRLRKYSGLTHGMEYDSRFKYGMCRLLNGITDLHFGYCTLQVAPYQHDFIYEMEYEIVAQDLDNTENYLYSHLQAWGLLIRENKLAFIGFVNGANRLMITSNTLELGYQRFRVTRTYDDGVKLFRNYSKEGGVWEELTSMGSIDTINNVQGSWFNQGTMIGSSTVAVNHFVRVGRYTENDSYTMFGRVGYVKLAIGTSEFKYEGVNFNQKPLHNFMNKGFGVLAMQGMSVGSAPIYDKGIARMVMVKEIDAPSALVESKHTAIKVKGAVEAGRDMAVKIELEKASDQDPSGLEGFAVSFSKK